jgi:tetratricopeptide (TPR) repeat protein
MTRATLRIAAALALALIPTGALAAPKFVIPPAQEPLVLEMLGGKDKLPGGCVLDSVSIQAAVIDATYACGDAKPILRLEHPSVAAETAKKTKTLALSPPGGLPADTVGAIIARIEKRESTFQWQSVVDGSSLPSAAAPPPPASASAVAVPPEDADAYARGLELYRNGKSREAYDVYLALARKNPRHPGALGMVVATLAGSNLSEKDVRRLIAAADAAPNDPLPQFLAGVASHYYAHEDADSLEEKRAWYDTALRYLDRARAYDFEARWHIYHAVTHFRLGHQAEAEAAIERAVALGSEDPDVYYCRAEIFQRSNIPRALEDIRRYQAMVAAIVKNGGTTSPDKAKRVELMYAHLLAVSRGEASPKEIFDPVDSDPYRRVVRKVARKPAWFAGVVLLVGGLGFIGLRAARRRSATK